MPKPLIVWITTNWKILKEMGIPDHLTCFLRNPYQVRKQQLELDLEQQTGSILSRCLFNLYAEYIMINAWLGEAQAGIKIARRNVNNLNMQKTPPLWQKVKRNWRAS